MAEQNGGDRRIGDLYGTLLAGSWCLVHSAPVTSAQAEQIVAGIEWRDYLDRDESPDDVQCVRHILDGQVTHKGEHTRIGTLVWVALGNAVEGLDVDRKTARRLLQDNDITITNGTHLAIAYGSNAITRILRDTRFVTDWQGHIKRFKGYLALPSTSFGNSAKVRAHGLPLEALSLAEKEPIN